MHFKIPKTMPDWRSYKVEGIPELMWTKKALEVHGLKDPWLRNEVWRYQGLDPRYSGPRMRLFGLFTTGFKYGLILAIISTAITKVLESRDSHHGGHDEHGASHH